jgi:hypothetical protein
MIRRSPWRTVIIAALCQFAAAQAASAGEPASAFTPRTAAQIDLTGFWVSVVTEDWMYRMVTPPKGARGSIPLNPTGARVANEWDPARDIAQGDSCKAYGAAGLMRRPGRLHISWEDDRTLRIDFDAGIQTRLLHFAPFLPPEGFGTSQAPLSLLRFQAPPGPASLQGYSVAAWEKVAQISSLSIVVMTSTPPPTPGQGGALMVVTTHMQPGYLQKNGIPYSADAVLTEYFNRIRLPDAEEYLIVTSIVEDPVYLGEPYITSTEFKREKDNARWSPTPCNPS